MTDSPKANYTGKYLDDSFKFSRFIRVLRKRWIVIAAVSASVFAANAFYTFTRSPLYRSNTSLLISSSTIAVSDIQIPGINPDGPKVNLGTEIGILKSRPLVEISLAKLRESASGNNYKDLDPLGCGYAKAQHS